MHWKTNSKSYNFSRQFSPNLKVFFLKKAFQVVTKNLKYNLCGFLTIFRLLIAFHLSYVIFSDIFYSFKIYTTYPNYFDFDYYSILTQLTQIFDMDKVNYNQDLNNLFLWHFVTKSFNLKSKVQNNLLNRCFQTFIHYVSYNAWKPKYHMKSKKKLTINKII